MAGLKKPAKKRDNTNPNTALIVFLVVFVLLAIGMGVWRYLGFEEEEKNRKAVIAERAKTEAAKLVERLAWLAARDAWLAAGYTLEPDDLNAYLNERDEFLNPAGKFAKEPAKPVIEKMMLENKNFLGDDGAKKYQKSYKAEILRLQGEIKKVQGEAAAAQEQAKQANDNFLAYKKNVDDNYQKNLALIKQGNAAALTERQKRSAEMEQALATIKDLETKLAKLNEDFGDEKRKILRSHQAEVAKLKEKIALLDNTQPAITRGNQEVHALMLDISKGKALWDAAMGKILRVDWDARQVVIDVGSDRGLKPGVTFNVFGKGWENKAEGELKGTIEVLRVGATTSVARITSLYEPTGREILLHDPTRGRALRESENPIKKDDLLFHLFWGSHVVVAGNVNWSGYASDSPAEQMRNLFDFLRLLEKQGVIIDAYVDLTDGQLKGAITGKTRFLIRGDALAGEGKEEGKGDRGKVINDKIAELRNFAADKGLFIISAENFANVVGYRRPHSAAQLELSSFRPFLPTGGQGVAGLIIPKAPGLDEEKKEKEKDKEP